jgi:hypothetical protein
MFFFFFCWVNFCVIAKVAMIHRKILVKFGYKLNMKVIFLKHLSIYIFWLSTTSTT